MSKKRQTISVRRRWKASESSVRKRGQALSKQYGFEIIDELVTGMLHIIMADLTDEQIQKLVIDRKIHNVDDMPRITLN